MSAAIGAATFVIAAPGRRRAGLCAGLSPAAAVWGSRPQPAIIVLAEGRKAEDQRQQRLFDMQVVEMWKVPDSSELSHLLGLVCPGGGSDKGVPAGSPAPVNAVIDMNDGIMASPAAEQDKIGAAVDQFGDQAFLYAVMVFIQCLSAGGRCVVRWCVDGSQGSPLQIFAQHQNEGAIEVTTGRPDRWPAGGLA